MSIYAVEKYANGALVERDVADTVAGTFVVFDGAGGQQSTRPLTAAELAQYAASDLAAAASAGDSALAAKLLTAIVANGNDATQDGTVQSGAATIQGTAGPFSLTQCTTFIKQLAQAANVLAGNDMNTKRQLTAIDRKLLGQTADTSGT